MKHLINKYWHNHHKIRYLAASAFNTAFGYSAVVTLHYLLSAWCNMLVIGLIASVMGITMSFVTLRLFVFKSQGNWLHEYMRCFVVYGSVTAINVIGLWLLVDIFGMSVWLAPFIITPICFIASYFSHKKFTFKY